MSKSFDFSGAQGIQRRTISAELRVGAGDEFALVGYASKFNTLSSNLGGFRETVKPGAFMRSIQSRADVKALFNHDPSTILGRTKAGTLSIAEDDQGLRFRCELDKTSQSHRDIYAAVKRGDIDECSFAFTVPDGGQSWAEGKDPETGKDCAMRTLTNVVLLDVSVVTYPAYPNTQADARAQGGPVDWRVPDARVLAQLRRAERAMSDAVIAAAKRDYSPKDYQYDPYMTLDQVYAAFHRCLESACALSEDIGDSLQDWPDDDSDRGKMKRCHTGAHEVVRGLCDGVAANRLALGKMLGRGKK